MQRLAISCEKRQLTGKGAARKIRRDGLVPGILYGEDLVVPLTINPKEIEKVLSSQAGENAIFQLNLVGEKKRKERNVILRDLQYDTVKGHLLHADLYEISMDEELEVDVPLELEGQPAGVEEGGVLTQVIQEIRVKCLPGNIPDRFVLDVSALNIGDSLHVANVAVPEGVSILEEAEKTVVNVAAPRIEEVVEEVAEEAEEAEAEAGEEAREEAPREEAKEEGAESAGK